MIMKQSERKAIAMGDDAAVLCETSNTESRPMPRLTILNATYVDEHVSYPASSVTAFGQGVRDLYEMLHDYYQQAEQTGKGTT